MTWLMIHLIGSALCFEAIAYSDKRNNEQTPVKNYVVAILLWEVALIVGFVAGYSEKRKK